MSDKLKLEIVSPDKLVLSEEVDEVVVPGSQGQFGVLPGHTSFLATLDVGELTYQKEKTTGHIFVSAGYAEVSADKITILADSSERASDIDVARAEESMQRAEDRLVRAPSGIEPTIDLARAEVALKKSLVRLQIAKGRTQK